MTLKQALKDRGIALGELGEFEVDGLDFESDSPSVAIEEGEGAAEIRIRIPAAE